MKEKIDVVSTARSEFNHCYSIAKYLNDSGYDVRLVLSGSHSKEKSQNTTSIDSALFTICFVDAYLNSDSLKNKAQGLAALSVGFSHFWSETTPDAVVFVGDRYELLAPATIALIANIPIIHAYGGECDVSYCIDTAVRNSLTNMASLHLVAHEQVKERLLYLGEETERVTVIGNIALSDLPSVNKSTFLEYASLQSWGDGPFVVACYLPTTSIQGAYSEELDELLLALESYNEYTFIWAGVNSDYGSEEIRRRLIEYCSSRSNHFYTDGLGKEKFFSLLQSAKFMIGNSSSGFLEASSFNLPVINVGTRQTGRLSGLNVFNVPAVRDNIKVVIDELIASPSYSSFINPFKLDNMDKRLVHAVDDFMAKSVQGKLIKRYVQSNPEFCGPLKRCQEYL